MVDFKKGGRRAPLENPVKLAVPGENDILCGKDRACVLHKGSQHFRAVLDFYRAAYQKAVTKYDKMQITKEIYQVLSRESRFLKYNDKEKLWEEITAAAARDKVGHALRFANNCKTGSKNRQKQKKCILSKKALALKRQGSFSSTESGPSATKAELVQTLVEVAKEEPTVWGTLVDHLTEQDAAAAAANNAAAEVAAGYNASSQAAGGQQHTRRTSMSDPIALENIAYAVDCNNDNNDGLDELIDLLNNEEFVTEDHILDVLDLAANNATHTEEVPPSVVVNVSAIQTESCGTLMVDMPLEIPSSSLPSSGPGHHRRRSSTGGMQIHKRLYSVDDDMWSVMREPLLDDFDWQ